MDIQEEIQKQIVRVNLALTLWQQSDELFEVANWMAYQAAQSRLDALYALAKREKLTA